MIKKYKINSGITLVSLVVTIMVLLMLSGIVLYSITSENGIISKAKIAKNQTELNEEKENLDIATINAMQYHKYGNIEKELLLKELEEKFGKDSVEIEKDGDIFIIFLKNSKRYYTISKNGDIAQYKPYIDNTPGELEGKGTKDDPFKIESVEDLIVFSQNINNNVTRYKNQYIVLSRTLDFESKKSYCNSETTEYNEYLGIDTEITLIKAMTDKSFKGFKMIGEKYSFFAGTFDGQGYALKNIYINSNNASLFGNVKEATIENLLLTGEIIGGDSIASGFVQNADNASFYNCYNEANITGTTVGGICVHSSGDIVVRNCYNTGKISGKWQSGAGGIIAYSTDTNGTIDIKNSYNTGEIILDNGTSYAAAGGIIGGNSGTLKISNCYSTSKNKSSVYSGAIVGLWDVSKVTLDNCYFLNNMNKTVGNGEVTVALMCDETYMKSKEFISKLNSYVQTYNLQDENSIKLLMWKQTKNNKFPELNIK